MLVFVSLAPASGSLRSPRTPSFEDRVKAQEAIERVYYSHQAGATLPFEEAVPRAALEKKVVTYLKKTIALEKFWNTPVTAAALEAEMRRIADRTRFPERLLEIYAALDNDPFLVQECFARPALVDRLIRGFWRDDSRWTQDLPAVPLPGSAASPSGIGWDEWWNHVQPDLDVREPLAQADTDVPLPPPNGTRHFQTAQPPGLHLDSTCLPDDTWDNGVLDDSPFPTTLMSTVWTGSLMIVWGGTARTVLGGGTVDLGVTDFGGRYDPLTDTWSMTSRVGAPAARMSHTAVWTGSRMLVWGGRDEGNVNAAMGTGGSYDPATDAWTPLSNAGAPAPRWGHTAVWTGSRMLVWGGIGINDTGKLGDGAQYSPTDDQWSPVASIGAPSARYRHTAVWTGSQMIVWGGEDASSSALNTGARYVPTPGGGSWSPVSQVAAPVGRNRHTAIWSGSRMVIWGGSVSPGAGTSGGLYDPATDTWNATSLTNAPAARLLHTAIWTGSRMLVWGGRDGNGIPLSGPGGSFDPASNTWTTLSSVAPPEPRSEQVAVWTGSLMIVWGGSDGFRSLASGGRYDPATNSWTSTATLQRPDLGPAVWTGNEMIVWSGSTSLPLDPGARYDPLTDDWTDLSTIGAPSRRFGHSMIWTGSHLIVWGGRKEGPPPSGFGFDALSTGARYDPINDAWTPMSQFNGRGHHSALWTGSRMLVWGGGYTNYFPNGSSAFVVVDSGGSYDPASDFWTSLTTTGAPAPRSNHRGVWTGSLMVIWGGNNDAGTNYNTGGIYDPASNSWVATSSANAPSARTLHSAIWTGSRMVVWGGSPYSTSATGRIFDPVANSWTPVSTSGAPEPRTQASAVWTGREMLIWGGRGSQVLGTGGRYDPVADSWLPMSNFGAPNPSAPAAVWTGAFLIVYGGPTGGGRYAVDQGFDNDGDGFSDCAGDCADNNPAVHPGASEVCNTVDDDCDGVTDEGFTDADGDSYPACGGDCDDTNPSIHPGAAEVCNHLSDDCDSLVDEGFPNADGDGYAACAGDCNDSNPNIHPDATEICNGIDDDCDALTNEAFDSDGDGFSLCAGDCNESNPAIYPGAAELCNGVDDDCDDFVDDLPDNDGDGYTACTGDCNDSSGSIHPGAVEICDGLDNDCDNVVDEVDADADGYLGCGGPDCNDSNPVIHPDAQETCNGVDDNCNLVIDDSDLDGDGVSGCGADCNDADPSAWGFPFEVEGLHPNGVSLSEWIWDSQATSIGPGVVYDVASGPITSSRVDLFLGSCVATVSSPQFTDTQPNPALGWGTWFLVLAKNSCLVGDYGTDSFGNFRPVPPCP